ncbi:MAG: PBP1A family penicillin-binding protein [Alicyclobacillaceae bacterium]|nr:PBP1A family penicillin-binding protein [Alicyclobacillaceae bacterium]
MPAWVKLLAVPLCAGFAGTTALIAVLKCAPLPTESLINPTVVEAGDGSTLAELSFQGAHQVHVPLGLIPRTLQEATIAVEDEHFYEHHAVNPAAIARALWVDVRHGRVVQGGSTITQQLAKNLFLSQDRTLTRKLLEVLYAIRLELHESKPAILEQYLNYVYYGHGAWGVGAASELYFNKPVQQLTLAEAAMLAGLPRGPAVYSPIDHFGNAKARQRVVLQRMVACGFITQAQADEAFRQPLAIAGKRLPRWRAPYFTVTAVAEAERRFAIPREQLYQGNYQITTSLDPVLQQAAERAIHTTLPAGGSLQAALVALDPHTGAIRALVGGRDFATSPYNRVLATRQPGSTFKAILYATALGSGWTPAHQVDSEPTTFAYDRVKRYAVHDFGGFYAHRPLTLREAVARSDNVYAVTANLEIGPQRVVDTARRMGITAALQPYPSLALGVFPVSPLELAAAYAVFANGGFQVQPYAVEEVRAGDRQVYQTQPRLQRVLSPQIAFQVTDLLTSVLQPHGTGYPARAYLHAPAAAKTGTTDTDGWIVGYTPGIVCAVWVGYDDNRPLTTAEAHLAQTIWGKFMGTAQERVPSGWFSPPDGLVKMAIDPLTGEIAGPNCPSREVDYFQKGTEPRLTCQLHQPPKAAETKPDTLWDRLRRWL